MEGSSHLTNKELYKFSLKARVGKLWKGVKPFPLLINRVGQVTLRLLAVGSFYATTARARLALCVVP